MSALIGSARSLEQLNKVINKWFYTEIILRPADNKGYWLLFNSKGRIPHCWVKKVKNRFRFEMTDLIED